MTFPGTAVPFSSSVRFYGTTAPTLGPNTAKVTQEEFSHDIAVLEFWGGDVNADSFFSGMPVMLTFGRPQVKRSFCGYVSHARRTNNALSTVRSLVERNSTVVVCVGASWIMKQTGNQAWPSQTASQTVQAVADLFGFATSIVPDSTIWPPIQMAGMTYWQLCVMLAKRIGYTFYCNGVQLVFKPRQTNPNLISGLVAVYDYRGNPGGMPVFTPLTGATSPDGGELVNRQLAGINPRTNQVVFSSTSGNPSPTTLGTYKNTPIFNRSEHCVVHTQEEASARTAGSGLSNQLYITATASASGDPMVAQGNLIYVANANGSQDGLWFVKKATHSMTTGTYGMNLDLGRDSLGGAASIRGSLQISTPPQPVLSNGTWTTI